MSVAYGGGPGGVGYGPAGRVNFGWIGESLQIFGKAAGIWIVGVLLYGIVSNAVNGLIVHVFPNPSYVAPPGPFGGVTTQFGIQYGTNSNVTVAGQGIAVLFGWVFGAFQLASLSRLAVRQVRGESVGFGDLIAGGPYFGNMLVLNLVMAFLYFAGFLAVCLGAFVVGAFFLPAADLVADGRSVPEALSQSVNGMKRDWLNATLFLFVFILLIIASVIPCGLGLFVTIPMLYITAALAYRDMIGMPGGSPPSELGYGTAAPGVWPPPPSAGPDAGAPPPQWGSGEPPPDRRL